MTVKASETTSADQLPPQDPAAAPTGAGLQPFLHDACVTLYAPSFTVSRADGQLTGGADGFYHGECRALARLEVSADGALLAPVSGGLDGGDRAVFHAALRGVAESTPDPAVLLQRRRSTAPGRLTETLQVVNSGRLTAGVRLAVTAGTDLAAMEQVKSGTRVDALPAAADGDGLRWADATMTVRLHGSVPPSRLDAAHGRLQYDITLAPGEHWQTELVCTAEPTGFTEPAEPAEPAGSAEPTQSAESVDENAAGNTFRAPATALATPWRTPDLHSADSRLDRWLAQSLADLRRLLLTDPQQPGDVFLAAGAPWFATLFGRDSLWAARMLLPLGTSLAASTLRVLARRQGTAVDPESQEQPGKILHEVRRTGLRLGGQGGTLPPVYYGTIDATPLWLILLHDAWRWGLEPAEIEPLLPSAEAALTWLAEHGDADGDGFLEYIDLTGRGLANQGWKDSGDSIRHRDGGFAEAPIALCEVQAYAYEAARGGAALLRAFGRPGADRWEEWAERLKTRFRERFWVTDGTDGLGPYPAVALDRDKKPVASVTSGFGHLLGTGLLDREESALLAGRLAAPDLDSGFGLRTMSSGFPQFNPLGYHIGSVWPHDTAIAVQGLTRAGFPGPAARLATGLIRAADAFDARLPELYAGYGTDTAPRPVPYPAACRPQAWAAASAVLVLQSLLGLAPDVPGGTLTVAPNTAGPCLPLAVSGLELGGAPLEITVTGDGTPRVRAAEGISVRVG